jgi:hypothetical protein
MSLRSSPGADIVTPHHRRSPTPIGPDCPRSAVQTNSRSDPLFAVVDATITSEILLNQRRLDSFPADATTTTPARALDHRPSAELRRRLPMSSAVRARVHHCIGGSPTRDADHPVSPAMSWESVPLGPVNTLTQYSFDAGATPQSQHCCSCPDRPPHASMPVVLAHEAQNDRVVRCPIRARRQVGWLNRSAVQHAAPIPVPSEPAAGMPTR